MLDYRLEKKKKITVPWDKEEKPHLHRCHSPLAMFGLFGQTLDQICYLETVLTFQNIPKIQSPWCTFVPSSIPALFPAPVKATLLFHHLVITWNSLAQASSSRTEVFWYRVTYVHWGRLAKKSASYLETKVTKEIDVKLPRNLVVKRTKEPR